MGEWVSGRVASGTEMSSVASLHLVDGVYFAVSDSTSPIVNVYSPQLDLIKSIRVVDAVDRRRGRCREEEEKKLFELGNGSMISSLEWSSRTHYLIASINDRIVIFSDILNGNDTNEPITCEHLIQIRGEVRDVAAADNLIYCYTSSSSSSSGGGGGGRSTLSLGCYEIVTEKTSLHFTHLHKWTYYIPSAPSSAIPRSGGGRGGGGGGGGECG